MDATFKIPDDYQIMALETIIPEFIVKNSQFTTTETIGRGGFGEVRKGKDRNSGKECAIKRLFSERFTDGSLMRYGAEIYTMAQTDNIFLVPFIGFTSQEPYCIVTEFMKHGSLDKYVRSGKQMLSGTQKTAIAYGIAVGVRHLHERGIIHRDLKASNILLDDQFLPKICDFGIARLNDNDDLGKTKQIGTANYMAPELMISTEYTAKVDVYSYSLMLYEMSEGIRAFKDMNLEEIFRRVITNHERPIFSARTPPNLQNLIHSCWADNPDDRPDFNQIVEFFETFDYCFPETKKKEFKKLVEFSKKDSDRRLNILKQKDVLWKERTSEVLIKIESDIKKRRDEENEDNSAEVIINDNNEQHVTIIKPVEDDGANFVTILPSTQERKQEEEFSDKFEDEIVFGPIFQICKNNKKVDKVLYDYENPYFPMYLRYYGETIKPEQFMAIYPPLAGYFLIETPLYIINIILDALVDMIKRDPEFGNIFAAVKLYPLLPVDHPQFIDKCVTLYGPLFKYFPNYLNETHISTVTQLLFRLPHKMLIYYSYYIKKFLSIKNPWPFLDLLYKVHVYVRDTEDGRLLLSIFHYLLVNFPIYKEQRGNLITPVIVSCIGSKDPSTACVAYNCMLTLDHSYTPSEITVIETHLRMGLLWEHALDLLIRIGKFPITMDLIYAIIVRAQESDLACELLKQIAINPEGAKLLMCYMNWVVLVKDHPLDVFHIVVILFVNPDYRYALSTHEYFPYILKCTVENGGPSIVLSIPSIIKKCALSPQFVQGLSESGFIMAYYEYVAKMGSQALYSQLIILIDTVARYGYCEEYVYVAAHLLEVIGDEALYFSIISLFVVLAHYPTIAKWFKDSELLPYFQTLIGNPDYDSFARILITLISQAV